MKIFGILLVVFGMMVSFSCKNENTSSKEKNSSPDQEIQNASENTPSASESETDVNADKQTESENAEVAAEIADSETAVYGSKGDDVNELENPDNLNMAFDFEEEDSSIEYIPLLFQKDKKYFFIQILESAKKLPKSHFEKMFPFDQKIYVAQKGENFVYAIDRVLDMRKAETLLKKYQADFDLKNAKIVSLVK